MSAEKKNKFRSIEVDEAWVEVDEQDIEKNYVVDYETKAPTKKNKPKAPKNPEPKQEKTPKTEEPKIQKKSETKASAKQKVSLAEHWEKFVVFYTNERTVKITGLVLILLSAYLSIAFISYFVSWDIDQDKVLGGAAELFKPETKVKNWLGKLGALVSHWCMYKGFGAASFTLVPVIFVYGLQKLTQKQLINIGAFNAKWLFSMVWGSLLLSYIFSDRLFFMGGGFGYFINELISNYLGNIGFIALLSFAMLTFLILVFNINFKGKQI